MILQNYDPFNISDTFHNRDLPGFNITLAISEGAISQHELGRYFDGLGRTSLLN